MTLDARFNALANQFFKPEDINRLSEELKFLIYTHPGNISVVYPGQESFELQKSNTASGYQVFDEKYALLFSGASTPELFGENAADRNWVNTTPFGRWCFVAYKTPLGQPLVDLVIRG
jgi:hypothetical protein